MTLAPGEEKSVHIAFEDKTFRFYDTRTNTWEVESGNYQIMVGTDADTMVAKVPDLGMRTRNFMRKKVKSRNTLCMWTIPRKILLFI